MRCNRPVRCWDFLIRPCRRPAGHIDNGNANCCNPFSDTPPMQEAPKPPASSYKNEDKELVAARA